MYHDLVFSTCHRVNVGGTVSHVFLPRKGQQQILTFFFRKVDRGHYHQSLSHETLHAVQVGFLTVTGFLEPLDGFAVQAVEVPKKAARSVILSDHPPE